MKLCRNWDVEVKLGSNVPTLNFFFDANFVKLVEISRTVMTAFDLLLPLLLLLLSVLSFACLLSSVHALRTRATLGLPSRVQTAAKWCSYMH